MQQLLRTQSTRSETGLVTLPPMLVPAGGTWNDDATSITEPMRTRTVRVSSLEPITTGTLPGHTRRHGLSCLR